MPVGTEVGIGRGHIVLDGDPAPNGARSEFSAHVCCGQMAGWIKMPLSTEVGLGPGDVVLDGVPAPPKRAQPPVFGPCLLWPNFWMDGDATWYRSRPQPRPYCVRRGPSSPRKRAQQPLPLFGPCLLWPPSPILATAEPLVMAALCTC